MTHEPHLGCCVAVPRHGRNFVLMIVGSTWWFGCMETDSSTVRAQVVEEAVVEALSSGDSAVPRSENHDFVDQPLESACQAGDVDAVILRVAAGSDVNARTSDGSTPLHLASKLPDPTIAMILLRAGADPNVADSGGLLPIDVLKAHELMPRDVELDDYFSVIQFRINEGIIKACTIADELIARGLELEVLRQQLILEHELEMQMLRQQAALYSVQERSTGYSLPMRFWDTDLDERPPGWMMGLDMTTPQLLPRMTHEYSMTPLPSVFYEPLDLPIPPQFAEAGGFLAYAVWQAELAFGADDPRSLAFKREIERALGF